MKTLNGMLAGLSASSHKSRLNQTAVIMEKIGGEDNLANNVRDANLSAMRNPKQPGLEQAMIDKLNTMLNEAKSERLECAIPLIQSLQHSLVKDCKRGTPPGVLTVGSWITLINLWDEQINTFKKRQVFYAKPFFKHALDKLIAVQSPLAILLQELLEMMEQSLEVEIP